MLTTIDPPSVEQSIARSFGADPVVMPVIDTLLQDVAALGIPVDQVIGVIRPLTLTGIRSVLDVGCGKGMHSVALARDLDLDVTGLDAHQPFLDEAQRRAEIAGVTGRCRFVAGDARRRLNGSKPRYDVVMALACPALFGPLADTVTTLRRCVRPGGFIIVDHDYALAPAAVDGDILDHAATAAALTAAGDRIVMEKHGRTWDAMALAELTRKALERRARELLRTYPGVAGTVWEWVESMRRQVAVHASGGPLMPSIWVVQKVS